MNCIFVTLIVALPCCFGFYVRSLPGNCNADLTAATGRISSPGHPNNYPDNQNCTYKITVAVGKKVKVTFTNFSLEADSSCTYDKVQIIDGLNVKTYCGSTTPPPFTSASNSLVLKFVSDISVTKTGFLAEYETVDGSVPSVCNAHLTTATGTCSSPGYPARYTTNQNCTCKIDVQTGKRVELTFTSFSLEAGTSCSYDYVQITDGSDVKKYCGSTIPPKFVSQSNKIEMNFVSDHSINDAGYQATYKTVDAPVPDTPNGANCGKSFAPQGRVIGGTNATRGAWPWQIGIFSKHGGFFCGGSLISPRWVVTASHCVDREQPANIYVKAGDLHLVQNDGTEQKVDVEKIVMHEKYNLKGKINNDIALLKLKTPVMLFNDVNTVCIPEKSTPIAVNTSCYITGWGKIEHPGNSHPALQQATLKVIDTKVCQTKLDKMNWGMNITDSMVCGGVAGSRKSGCHGDSGGPFVCKDPNTNKFVLHGAVSWGSGRCSTLDMYTVFARVQALRDWIDKKMKEN